MSEAEIVLVVLMVLILVVAAVGMNAAYRNGVCDGYGYAKEPRNPGYAFAGRYLKRHMAQRWPELREAKDVHWSSGHFLDEEDD